MATDNRYMIAVVGAGPGGLAAAARAAELGISHVLLEATADIANTVRRYQKGKLVMTEPAQLPLRSSLGFVAGTRESTLASWQQEIVARHVNLQTGATVSAISGQRGDFRITLASGEQLAAECVVLAIGLQGNIRKLGVPGEDLPGVQYQLDDPEAYRDETILVIGGGDAGVENALALAARNHVILLNRQEDFVNCREANYKRLKEAVAAGRLETRVSTSVLRIEAGTEGLFPLSLVAQSEQGLERIDCHRIVARLGATPPRKALESFGVRFPSSDSTAVPELSEQYESNVPGLYIVGSLAGYPLIKQALNQGYEAVEHIVGNPVEPADESLLRAKFSRIPGLTSAAEGIDLLRSSLPLLASLTTLQLREFMLDSDVLVPHPSDIIFRKIDYGSSFFSILQGSVNVHVEGPDDKASVIALSVGDFFGEVGLISGRRRSCTVTAGADCVLVETSRRSMLKLLDSVPGVQRRLDAVVLQRIVRSCFGVPLSDSQVEHLVQETRAKRYAVGEVLFKEGDPADALYMIRRGSVTVSRQVDGKEVVAAYVSAGSYVGEMALVSKMPRSATVRAAAPTEVVLLDADRFNAVLDENPSMRSEVTSRYLEGLRSKESAAAGKASTFVEFLMAQGIGEATDVLLIDYAKCTRCDNCERACAEVHDGISRLNRTAGKTYDLIHVPAACRHCESPRCMKDCPPDAIHRSSNGEVFISEACIGCGNCESNCPYGVIRMASKIDYQRPSLLELVFGWKNAPLLSSQQTEEASKLATKCDMCMGIIGGPSCVRACPTGAAFRVNPEQFLALSGS